MWHLFTGKNLRQLFCATRRVLGWNDAQGDIMATGQYGAQH